MAEDRCHPGGQFQEGKVGQSAPLDPTLTSEQRRAGRETAIGPRDPVHQSDHAQQPAPAPSAHAALRGQVTVTADPLVEVAVRVYADFADHVTVTELLAIMSRCRKDLDTANSAALPEMLERLARQRLAARTAFPDAHNGAIPGETSAGSIGQRGAD